MRAMRPLTTLADFVAGQIVRLNFDLGISDHRRENAGNAQATLFILFLTTGTKTVTLKLKAGSYKFYCPSHEAEMFGHFTVK